MNRKQLKDLRRELIRELNLDRSASTASVCLRLCDVVGNRLRQPIHLYFDDLSARGLSGYWAQDTAGSNFIFVTTARSWPHRLLILLHELAHMICGHEPGRITEEEGSTLFTPDLSPGLLRMLARRTTLTAADEQEAEQVAGALMQDLLAVAGQQQVDPFQVADDDAATRVWYSLGFAANRS
ncbi:hypothetical protein N8J89_03885 [Crossiella sp. CA-258035]|uniref:hypothetical protein n=1 Tax=Crossiella sp. CA-258035 TaxID=2981138 RepID=UPI0024BC9903|nr:hypothetical protein [Crossiella sp. CA-258035]WHT20224.1 hypothetical protein N8J89_03885 [Crossiella sp. CA-258035]